MRLNDAINIEDLHQMAKRRLPKVAFDFIEGGLEDERGLTTNTSAFHKHRLLPRYLVDVSKRDQTRTVFGQTFRVLGRFPLDTRVLRRELSAREIGTLEIKKRGVDIDPAQFRTRLGLRGPETATLVLTRIARPRVAILAERT